MRHEGEQKRPGERFQAEETAMPKASSVTNSSTSKDLRRGQWDWRLVEERGAGGRWGEHGRHDWPTMAHPST